MQGTRRDGGREAGEDPDRRPHDRNRESTASRARSSPCGNPADRCIIAHVPSAGAEDVERATRAAAAPLSRTFPHAMLDLPRPASCDSPMASADVRRRLSAFDEFARMGETGTFAGNDRPEKQPRYAAAGVPEAWPADTAAGTAAVYTGPGPEEYAGEQGLRRGEVAVPAGVAAFHLPVENVIGSRS